MFSQKKNIITLSSIENYKEPKFIEERDIKVLNNLGVNFETDIKIFLIEIRKYFNTICKKRILYKR